MATFSQFQNVSGDETDLNSTIEYGGIRVPSNWRFHTFPELVIDEPYSLTAGPFGTIFKAQDFRPTGVPILQIRHITENGFQFDGRLTFMDVAVYEKVHVPYTVHPGDLLIAKMGDPPGIACLYPQDAPVAMVTPDVIKATLNRTIIHPDYAVFMLNNHRARANILRLCKGGTRTRVSLGEFYGLRWPVPEMDRQFEILEVLQPITGFRQKALDRIKAIRSMKKSLMMT